MNIKKYALVGVLLLCANTLFSQSDYNLLNAQTPEDIGKVPEHLKEANNEQPLSYGYVDDRDILWSKVVWEHIDLNERINLPLYYPIDSTYIESSRKSLFYTLLKGVKSGEIKEVYDDSFFRSKLTLKEINQKLTRLDTSDYAYELLNEGQTNIKDYVDEVSIKSEDIDGYRVKGIWYFDKRQGEMRYRILALAPMAPDVQVLGREDLQMEESLPLFWVYYPSARKVLHKGTAFNEKNHRSPISFDKILNARRFSSIILREENLYGNRSVADYIRGNSFLQVLESERIKENIRDKEIDMWNY
jgi:gliding motility associated protien GldN